jgi:C-terminal domain of 1-Cys peroxiredoxin
MCRSSLTAYRVWGISCAVPPWAPGAGVFGRAQLERGILPQDESLEPRSSGSRTCRLAAARSAGWLGHSASCSASAVTIRRALTASMASTALVRGPPIASGRPSTSTCVSPRILNSTLGGVAGDPEARTPADNATVRNVFVIGPDKKIKLILVYPMTTGRNFDEVVRVIDSLQLTATHRVATPVNWAAGQDVIIAGSVSNEEARELYPDGWKAPRPYLRIVPDPREQA